VAAELIKRARQREAFLLLRQQTFATGRAARPVDRSFGDAGLPTWRRTCATDVPQALAPKGPGREVGRLTCADARGAGPAGTTTGGFTFLMCHKCATSDCPGASSRGVRRIAGL
jgi:hypothetical protein